MNPNETPFLHSVGSNFSPPTVMSLESFALQPRLSAATNPTTTAALQSEFFRKQIQVIDVTNDIVQLNDGKIKVRISCDLDANEGNGAITEAGIFNASANGTMYNRVVFPPVNKTTDFQLTLIWEITF